MNIAINALILRRGEYSGVHVAVRGLINAVAEAAGPDERILLYVQRRPPPGLPPPTADGRVRHIRPLWPVCWRAGRITWEQFRLYSRVFADGVDILHCPAYVMPHWCLKPTAITVHDMFALRQPHLCTVSNRSHFQRMLPKSLLRARRVLVPTAAVRDEIIAWNAEQEKRIPDLECKITVIPWGVDERFRPVEDEKQREALALRYGLPPKFVLFVGRPEPKKNLRRLVEAYFAAIMSRKLPHRLVLVGPRGWGVERGLRRLIEELDIENRVVRLDFVPDADLPAIYSSASALAFPSLAEGFGLPVLEAMACGTPVICSDIPALREVAGEAALLVKGDDLPALRLAFEEVLGREETALRLRAAGLARAALFNWQHHGSRTLEVYREVAAADRRRIKDEPVAL